MTSPLFFDDARPDIALERDRAYEDRVTYRDFEAEKAAALEAATDWGSDEDAIDWVDLAEDMMAKRTARMCIPKSRIERTTDSWYEAVEEASIRMGLGMNEFSPHVCFDGWVVNLYL